MLGGEVRLPLEPCKLCAARVGERLERAMGIEPTSSAWEAEVMAIIRRPQNCRFYRGSGGNGKRGVWVGCIETGIVVARRLSERGTFRHSTHTLISSTIARQDSSSSTRIDPMLVRSLAASDARIRMLDRSQTPSFGQIPLRPREHPHGASLRIIEAVAHRFRHDGMYRVEG